MSDLIARAKKLFRDFTGRAPSRGDIGALNFTQKDTIVFVPGVCESIIYTANRDGKRERYIHDFKNRPVLAISSDGKQAYILAGGYRFTERGFVDTPHRRLGDGKTNKSSVRKRK